jgi:hypothetical protein
LYWFGREQRCDGASWKQRREASRHAERVYLILADLTQTEGVRSFKLPIVWF